jgi:rhodanese-related sulfurtransferase
MIDVAVDDYLSSMPRDYHAIRSVAALKRFLESEDSLLVDVRTASEYNSGHIPGAVNIPLNLLGMHVAEIPVDQHVVLYCSTGFRSAMGVMALQLEGRRFASGFPPSINGWKEAGETLETS